MSKRFAWIGCTLAAVLCVWTGCKDDVTTTGQSVLDADDAIIVLTDTFGIRSSIDSCKAIAAQADSFLLGEIETDYGLLRRFLGGFGGFDMPIYVLLQLGRGCQFADSGQCL